MLKVAGIVIGVVIVIIVLAWIFQGNDFFLYKAFAPKYEQTRHDVFKNSQAYTDGKVQELQQYMLDYKKAETSAGHKAALKTVIIRESAKIDWKYLPNDLQVFINGLKAEQENPFKLN